MVIAPQEDASRHADSGRIVVRSATSDVMIGLWLLNPELQAEAELKAALAMSRLGEEPRPEGSPGGGAGPREVDARYLRGTWQVDQRHQPGRQVAVVLAWQVTRYATCLRCAARQQAWCGSPRSRRSPRRRWTEIFPVTPDPTIEVRVADVCLNAGTAVLLAGLTRALVATALAEARRGTPPAAAPPGRSPRRWPPRRGTGSPGPQPTRSPGRPSMRRRSAPACSIISIPRSASTATPRRSPGCCTGSTGRGPEPTASEPCSPAPHPRPRSSPHSPAPPYPATSRAASGPVPRSRQRQARSSSVSAPAAISCHGQAGRALVLGPLMLALRPCHCMLWRPLVLSGRGSAATTCWITRFTAAGRR